MQPFRIICWALAIIPLSLSFAAQAQDSLRTTELAAAEKLFDLHFTDAERDSAMDDLQAQLAVYKKMHSSLLKNSTPLPLWFNPVPPGMKLPTVQAAIKWEIPARVSLPKNKNELAFYSILQLASLIKNKKISSVELTRFFIHRIQQFGDSLHCVISVPEAMALQEARKADAEIAKGIYKGPLHGIPYGVKDLFAVKGTKTTWGATPYKDQVIDEDAFVVQQLRKAGGVLVAKFSLGALAMGDVWYGGKTRNPWNLSRGSSGSSAGSASATVAGLVPYAIGTETHGSIVSPATACGATGLRPSFGSISRSGGMTLSWTLDKIGPLCRSAEDAAIVFAAIHGTDGKDGAARNVPFNYTGKAEFKKWKIAYAKNYFDKLPANSNEHRTLETFRKMGAQLIPVNFPDSGVYTFDMIGLIIGAEAAAAFEELTLTNRDDLLTMQTKNDWPNQFRTARFIPAVEYINTNRHRYELVQKINAFMRPYDAVIVPTFAGKQLAITNLTGHPVVCLPNGFNKDKLPTSITIIGNLFDEATILAIAKAYQQATDFDEQHPPLFR